MLKHTTKKQLLISSIAIALFSLFVIYIFSIDVIKENELLGLYEVETNFGKGHIWLKENKKYIFIFKSKKFVCDGFWNLNLGRSPGIHLHFLGLDDLVQGSEKAPSCESGAQSLISVKRFDESEKLILRFKGKELKKIKKFID